MALPFSLALALKYLRPKRTFISVVNLISVVGVLLGVAVLLIVISVMSGFDDMWRDKILDFNAHITVTGWSLDEDGATIEKIQKMPGVKGAAPFSQGLVFVRNGNHVFTPVLRGIDPESERTVSRIPENIKDGQFVVDDQHAVIGRDLANRLGLMVGDKLLVYSLRHLNISNEVRLPEELTISGIFELGMWDFDMGFVITSLGVANELFGAESGAEGIQVMTADPYKLAPIVAALRGQLPVGSYVQTWMDMNRQLFAALRVEKNMMFFLLIFISIVAAFGIMNTLITLAVQKTKEIGLLKAVGFSSVSIMGVFLWQGLISGVIGTTSGIIAGLGILHYRNELMRFLADQFHLELFPKELYHLSEIPATVSWVDIVWIAVSVLVICTLAGVVPAYRAARLDPARALRYE